MSLQPTVERPTERTETRSTHKTHWGIFNRNFLSSPFASLCCGPRAARSHTRTHTRSQRATNAIAHMQSAPTDIHEKMRPWMLQLARAVYNVFTPRFMLLVEIRHARVCAGLYAECERVVCVCVCVQLRLQRNEYRMPISGSE